MTINIVYLSPVSGLIERSIINHNPLTRKPFAF